MSFANVEKLEELGRQLARTVTDGEAARLVLYGVPMRTLFLMHAALDPVVQGARERMRRKRVGFEGPQGGDHDAS